MKSMGHQRALGDAEWIGTIDPSREKLRAIAAALGADPVALLWERDRDELVRRYHVDPEVAEVMLRLHVARRDERSELLAQFDQQLPGRPATTPVPLPGL
jgi:hypothetical protein